MAQGTPCCSLCGLPSAGKQSCPPSSPPLPTAAWSGCWLPPVLGPGSPTYGLCTCQYLGSRDSDISKFWFLVFIKCTQVLSVRETGALMEAHIECHSYLESLHKWGPGGAIIVPVLRASTGCIRAPSLSPTFKTISPRNFNNLLPKNPTKICLS